MTKLGILLAVAITMVGCKQPDKKYVSADRSTYLLFCEPNTSKYPNGILPEKIAQDLTSGKITQLEANALYDKITSWEDRSRTAGEVSK